MVTIFAVLVSALLIARVLGARRFPSLNSWAAATRVGLAAMFVFTGAAHFVPAVREVMMRMLPSRLPNPSLIISLTGICEILGAIGLLVPRARRAAAWALIVFLVAVFPANARAARQHMMIAGQPATPLARRAAMQLVLIGLVWWAAARPDEAPPSV